ncbi:TonB-dependent receptor [Bacteroidales bacterium KA00251]|nr:TonB-dependent receptor [Bacteroidales bacterium KA00251]
MHAGYYIVRQVPLRYCFLGIFALLAFLGFRLSAQENTDKREQLGVIRIHGFIKDRGGEPISLASIRVVGKAIGAVSDLKGAYSFTLYPHSDSLTIETSCIGYKSVSKNLPNGVKQDTRIDFTLPDANLMLGAVTVTASSSKQKSNMETVKAEHIKAVVGPSAGIETLVSTYAGVTQQNELSSQYSVRGGSYDENMVYVNGMEVFRPLLVRSAQQEGLSFVQPEMIRSVNFSAGGYTAEYGDKMSSVLDIRYRTPARFEANIGMGLQNDHLYIGARKGKFSIIAGARFKDGRSMLKSMDTKGEYRPIYLDGQTYAQYEWSPQWKISFLGNVSFTHYSFIPQTRETRFGTINRVKNLKVYFDGQEQDRFLSFYGNMQLTYRQQQDLTHILSFVGYNSREQETYDIEGSYFLADLEGGESSQDPVGASLSALATGSNLEHARNNLNYSIATTNYTLLWTLNDTHTLKAGLDLRGEWVNDRISEWSKLDSAGYNIPHNTDKINVLYNLYSDNQLATARASAYIQDKISLESSMGIWQLYPGLRTSFYAFTKELIFSPRFVFAFSPSNLSKLTLRGATGLYYQAPFYKELRKVHQDESGNNYILLNKKIRSQGSLHFLLASDYSFSMAGRKFRFTTEAYFKYLFHLNPYRIENVKVRYLGDNVGRGYAMGLDFKLYGEFVPDVDSWITFSLLKSKQVLPGIGTMPFPNAPLYNFSLFFQDYFPGFKPIRLSLRAALSGGLPQFKPSASFEAPMFKGKAYSRVDLGVTYRLFEKSRHHKQHWLSWLNYLDLSVELFNLFDNANVSGYYWITDAHQNQFAVPNYLTRRQLNIHLVLDF